MTAYEKKELYKVQHNENLCAKYQEQCIHYLQLKPTHMASILQIQHELMIGTYIDAVTVLAKLNTLDMVQSYCHGLMWELKCKKIKIK